MGLQERAYDVKEPAYKPYQRTRKRQKKDLSQKRMAARQNRSVPASRYVIMIVAVVLVNVFLVGQHNTVLQRGYELSRMNQELSALKAENERLAVTIGQLESLDRIEQVAVTELGMVRADQIRLVAFHDSGAVYDEELVVAAETDRQPLFGKISAAFWGRSTRVEAGGTQP